MGKRLCQYFLTQEALDIEQFDRSYAPQQVGKGYYLLYTANCPETYNKIRSNDYIDILRPPSIGMMAPLI
jgi:hypothetical protein